jgi:hypothetical protein
MRDRLLVQHHQAGDGELFAAKHAGSQWIGDKRPNLQFCLEASYDNFVPGHRLCAIDLQRRRPEVFASIEFVHYAEVFSDPACSQRLFQQLGVELSPAEQGRLSEFLAASAARTPASPKDGDEPDALGARVEAVIARHLDREAELSLAAISGLPETRA